MANDYDPKIAFALLTSARTNRAIISALVQMQIQSKNTNTEVNNAINAALEAWDEQLSALEAITRG